jgi:hypothetical protein
MVGFKVLRRVNSPDHWLWAGAKPDKDKLSDAAKHNAKVSNPGELMELC